MITKLVKILSVMSIIVLLTGCGNDDQNQLVMATEAGFAPFEFYENGEIVGVDIEIAKEIANALDLTLVVKDVAFDNLINELNSGKADFIAAGMSINEDRAKEVDFTIEYITSNQVVIVNKNSNIKNLDDIQNKKIGTQLGSTADMYVTDNYKNANHTTYKKYSVAVEEIKTGKIDLIIMDSLPAKELVKNNPELVILDDVLFTDKYGMAVKKGNDELLVEINKVLERLIEENKIEEYIIKYSE